MLKKRLSELGGVRTIEDLERVIGVISYTRRCVKDVEIILGPLNEGVKTFKSGKVSEDWICSLNNQVKEAVKNSIANVHWLILPRTETDKFIFIIESDWSSEHVGYMLFASKSGEEWLLDHWSRMQKLVSCS